MLKRPIQSFVPHIYKDVVEMDDIMNTEESIMSIVRKEMAAAFANTFVLTSDESGVIMFEKMLNITAKHQTEDLEFRRERVLNRLSMSPPFTFNFLKQKLNEIIGVGAWTAYIDYNTYTLYVESSATDQNWYSEVEFTINRIKPCNLVFVNVPYTAEYIQLNETISYDTFNWRYRLGSWRLGQYPFATLDGGGTIKMPEIKSIQNSLLSSVAGAVVNTITAVLINDSIKITDFKLKSATDNVVSLEYSVTPQMASIMTNIKLLGPGDSVLTQVAVYVPITQTIVSKHLITVKEGA